MLLPSDQRTSQASCIDACSYCCSFVNGSVYLMFDPNSKIRRDFIKIFKRIEATEKDPGIIESAKTVEQRTWKLAKRKEPFKQVNRTNTSQTSRSRQIRLTCLSSSTSDMKASSCTSMFRVRMEGSRCFGLDQRLASFNLVLLKPLSINLTCCWTPLLSGKHSTNVPNVPGMSSNIMFSASVNQTLRSKTLIILLHGCWNLGRSYWRITCFHHYGISIRHKPDLLKTSKECSSIVPILSLPTTRVPNPYWLQWLAHQTVKPSPRRNSTKHYSKVNVHVASFKMSNRSISIVTNIIASTSSTNILGQPTHPPWQIHDSYTFAIHPPIRCNALRSSNKSTPRKRSLLLTAHCRHSIVQPALKLRYEHTKGSEEIFDGISLSTAYRCAWPGTRHVYFESSVDTNSRS